MHRTFGNWPRGLALAAGVGGTAALAAVFVSAGATTPAQQAQPVAVSSSMAPMPSAAASPASTVPAASGAAAKLTLPQIRAIAERTAGGRAEDVEPTGPAALSYQVSVVRGDGSETELVVDARSGRVINTVADPQDSAEPHDSAEPQDSADPQDSAEPQDNADPQDSADPQDNADPQDSTEPQDSTDPQDSADPGH
jgi:uncharacterized membrane protein YkoI